ncbi:MAG: hypothetical protein ACI97A_004355 [Planctomycetota bacterium]
MTDSQLNRAESNFVREHIKRMLNERGFALVLESDTDTDGWRAEFLGQIDSEDVILLAHKPFGAPFATLGLTMAIDGFEAEQDCRSLMDCASDFDIAVYLPQGQGELIHTSSRLLISGVNVADFDFTLNNLLFCRESIIAEFGENEEE